MNIILQNLDRKDVQLLHQFYNTNNLHELEHKMLVDYSKGNMLTNEDFNKVLQMSPVYEAIINTNPMEALKLCSTSKEWKSICAHPHFQKMWIESMLKNTNVVQEFINTGYSNDIIYTLLRNPENQKYYSLFKNQPLFWKEVIQKLPNESINKYTNITWADFLRAFDFLLAHHTNTISNDNNIQQILNLFEEDGSSIDVLIYLVIRGLKNGDNVQDYFDDIIKVLLTHSRGAIKYIDFDATETMEIAKDDSIQVPLLGWLNFLLNYGAKIDINFLNLNDSDQEQIIVKSLLFDFFVLFDHVQLTELHKKLFQSTPSKLFADDEDLNFCDKYKLFKWYSIVARQYPNQDDQA